MRKREREREREREKDRLPIVEGLPGVAQDGWDLGAHAPHEHGHHDGKSPPVEDGPDLGVILRDAKRQKTKRVSSPQQGGHARKKERKERMTWSLDLTTEMKKAWLRRMRKANPTEEHRYSRTSTL